MGFQFVQKSMTLNDIEQSKRICGHVTSNQKVISYGRNVRLILVY